MSYQGPFANNLALLVSHDKALVWANPPAPEIDGHGVCQPLGGLIVW